MNYLVGKSELFNALRDIGIRQGDRLIVHSSLKSMGPIDGGADAVLDALVKSVGHSGVIAMPTFTYSLTGYREGQPFHSLNTVSKTGMLTEIFRKREGCCRSLHPTHSVAVWGQRAEYYVRSHEKVAALGVDSPFHKLALDQALILLIGVDFDSLSLIHVAEAVAQVPYLKVFCWKHRGSHPFARILLADGRIAETPLSEVPGCSRNFGVLEPMARRAGLVRETKLGQATVKIVPGRALMDLTVSVLNKTPYFLLCPEGACPACDERRGLTENRVRVVTEGDNHDKFSKMQIEIDLGR